MTPSLDVDDPLAKRQGRQKWTFLDFVKDRHLTLKVTPQTSSICLILTLIEKIE